MIQFSPIDLDWYFNARLKYSLVVIISLGLIFNQSFVVLVVAEELTATLMEVAFTQSDDDNDQREDENIQPTPNNDPEPEDSSEVDATNNQCNFFRFQTMWVEGQGNWDTFSPTSLSNDDVIASNIINQILAELDAGRKFCREKAINMIIAGNSTQGLSIFNPATNTEQPKFDDCVALYFGVLGLDHSNTVFNYDADGNFVQNGENSIVCNLQSTVSPDVCLAQEPIITYYFDINGLVIPKSAIQNDAQMCDVGSYQWQASPISLIWNSASEIDAKISITRFPVDPTLQGNYFLWKASADTPLLVFDPSRSGKIVSAEQLFGNWTFGGKQSTALQMSVSDVSPSVVPTLWRDGFEALGSLDINADNKISNAELEPLALWFDENQDGVSQVGEVKSLSELGVTALFYHPDREELATRNIIATHGFERIVDGKVISGTSVDWHSSHASTKEELIAKLYIKSALEDLQLDYSATSLVSAHETASEHHDRSNTSGGELTSIDQGVNISGFWRWTTRRSKNSSKLSPLGGYLSFSDKEDTKISGHSYGMYEFPYLVGNAKGMMSITSLVGNKRLDTTGNIFINFEIASKGKSKVKSEAKIIKHGTEMIGKTSATVSENGKPITITYRWAAKRA